jgi:hypothetical protein
MLITQDLNREGCVGLDQQYSTVTPAPMDSNVCGEAGARKHVLISTLPMVGLQCVGHASCQRAIGYRIV